MYHIYKAVFWQVKAEAKILTRVFISFIKDFENVNNKVKTHIFFRFTDNN